MGYGKLLNSTPIPYVGSGELSRGLFGFGGRGVQTQLSAMGANGTLFSIVNRTSTSTAAVNWHMHRKTNPGSAQTVMCDVPGCGMTGVTNVLDHLALKIFNKPNDFYTRQELVETDQQHIDLTGEGWLVVGRDPTFPELPLDLWPVRPDRIDVIPDKEDFIAGYMYRGPRGEQVPLNREDVLSMRMPNPEDPYRGMGPVQTILFNLDSARYSAEWNRNFFLNNAEPGGIIKVPHRMGDTEFREKVARWKEQHRGVSNAHRVAFLENGAEWVDRKYTQKDMQFAELSRLDKETIREAFGMPKFAVGDVADVNRATAEASKAWFAEALTVPRLDRWKGMLNNDFLPLFAGDVSRLEFVYTSPVPADREADNAELTSKASAYKTLVDAGVHPDDAAERVGLPKMRNIGRTGAAA